MDDTNHPHSKFRASVAALCVVLIAALSEEKVGSKISGTTMRLHLRLARPVSDLARATDMYCRGLRLRVVGRFENHEGFDGVMLGIAGSGYHFEFTYCRT